MINLNLADRRRATQATFGQFAGVSFGWAGATCIHALHFHLEQMGHTVPPMPAFRSATGARRALKAMGAKDLPELLRLVGLEEKVPARMILGDVAVLPGDGGPFDALVICAGNKFMGWHGATDGFQAMVPQMAAVKAAFGV